MTFDHDTLSLLGEALRTLDDGFSRMPDYSPRLNQRLF